MPLASQAAWPAPTSRPRPRSPAFTPSQGSLAKPAPRASGQLLPPHELATQPAPETPVATPGARASTRAELGGDSAPREKGGGGMKARTCSTACVLGWVVGAGLGVAADRAENRFSQQLRR
jgi:hypothetical protein